MKSYDSVEAAMFGPPVRRPPPRRHPSWGAVFRTLAFLSTVFLSFFGVYELDRYWNNGHSDSTGVSAVPSLSYGPSINWGGRR